MAVEGKMDFQPLFPSTEEVMRHLFAKSGFTPGRTYGSRLLRLRYKDLALNQTVL
ncbi:MAG: hypothetical protein LBL45_12810 [Treponema sp.]|jgi:hypothetical protein|nr:hypothetical protein [Treponema sp.]